MTNIIETRHFVFDNTLQDKSSVRYNLTDLSAFLNYKLNQHISFNLAYTLRVQRNLLSHRAIQQLLVNHQFKAFSLQQRLGFDQTFNVEDFAVYRMRYRLSFIIPLKGKSLEEKECYLNLANEYMGSTQNKVLDLEARIIPKLGYVVNKNNKFEFGLDYRVTNFIQGSARSVYWWNFTWYASIHPEDKIALRN